MERIIMVWLAIIPLAARKAFALRNAAFTCRPEKAGWAASVTQTSTNVFFVDFGLSGSEPRTYVPAYFDQFSHNPNIKGTTSTAAPFSRPVTGIIYSLSTNPFRTFGSLYA